MIYYIYVNEQQIGPLTIDQIGQQILTPTTKVWREDQPIWKEAKEFKELEVFFPKKPPPLYMPPLIQNTKKGNVINAKKNNKINLYSWIAASVIDYFPLLIILVIIYNIMLDYKIDELGSVFWFCRDTLYPIDYLRTDLFFCNSQLNYEFIPFLTLLLYGLYFVFTDGMGSTSLGKYLLGIRLINVDNSKPQFWKVYLRYIIFWSILIFINFIITILADFLNLWPQEYFMQDLVNLVWASIIVKFLLLILMCFMIKTNNDNQCFHDKICKTKKIK